MDFLSRSAAATRDLAAALGAVLAEAGSLRSEAAVVALSGPLGAGKTEFVRGLAHGAGGSGDWVASPTFVIANEYPLTGRLADRLVHLDLYRIESEAELEGAGYFDWLGPGAILAIEWADRFPRALPERHLAVQLERVGATGRRIRSRPRGREAEAWDTAWSARLAADPAGA